MTRFEEQVAKWPRGNAIVSERSERFDVVHGLFFAPINYVPRLISLESVMMPDEEWVRSEFLRLVRDEFVDNAGFVGSISIGDSRASRDGLHSISTYLRDISEQVFIYSQSFGEIFSDISVHNIEERLERVLNHQDFGNRKNRDNLEEKDLEFLHSRMRVGVRFVFPGLPFRDQNPFRTDGLADHVTLAEAYYLIRLHCTALSIYQVLPTGADILILSDGSFFGGVLGVESDRTRSYLRKMRDLRDALNLSGTLQIVELKEIVQIYDNGSGIFDSTTDEIQRLVLGFMSAAHDEVLGSASRSIDLGVRRNFNLRQYDVDPAILNRWLAGDANADGVSGLPAHSEMRERSARYAALNLALKWHNVISKVLPTTIRATVHPKPGQIGLPRLGSCLPWNGVAINRGATLHPNSLEIHTLSEASRRGLHLIPVVDETGSVLYYEGSKG